MQCQHVGSATDAGNGERASTTHDRFPWVIHILLVSFNYHWQECIANQLRPKILDLYSFFLISVTSCSPSSFPLPPLFLYTHKPESLKDNSSFKTATLQDLIKPLSPRLAWGGWSSARWIFVQSEHGILVASRCQRPSALKERFGLSLVVWIQWVRQWAGELTVLPFEWPWQRQCLPNFLSVKWILNINLKLCCCLENSFLILDPQYFFFG